MYIIIYYFSQIFRQQRRASLLVPTLVHNNPKTVGNKPALQISVSPPKTFRRIVDTYGRMGIGRYI